jgi:hypothetical protein
VCQSLVHQKITTLAVAYYNLAVELQHEHMHHQALQVPEL